MKKNKNEVAVICVGGSGKNIANSINMRYNLRNIYCLSSNSHALWYRFEDRNGILVGTELTYGLGCRGNPSIGEEAVRLGSNIVVENLKKFKVIILIACLGGGTTTGGSIEFVKIAKKMGIKIIGIHTIPFNFEGERRKNNAEIGLNKIKKYEDETILINVNKLSHTIPKKIDLIDSFSIIDDSISMIVNKILNNINAKKIEKYSEIINLEKIFSIAVTERIKRINFLSKKNNFIDAFIKNVNVQKIEFDYAINPQLVKNKSLCRCNFNNVDLSDKDFTGVDIRGCNLKGTNARINPQKIKYKSLYKTNLEGIDMSGMDFTGVDVWKCNLKNTGADLTGAIRANGAITEYNSKSKIEKDYLYINMNHPEKFLKSNRCGCIYCFNIFEFDKLKTYSNGTPCNCIYCICPYCGEGLIVGEAKNVKLDKSLLEKIKINMYHDY